MKTEDFDEAIRGKLENLHPPFNESEIDLVHRNVMSNRKFLPKGRTGSMLLYSLSAAAITIFSVLMVSHFRNTDKAIVKNDIPAQNTITAISDSNSKTEDTLIINQLNVQEARDKSEQKQENANQSVSEAKSIGSDKKIPVIIIPVNKPVTSPLTSNERIAAAEKENNQISAEIIDPTENLKPEEKTGTLTNNLQVAEKQLVIPSSVDSIAVVPSQNTSKTDTETSKESAAEKSDTSFSETKPSGNLFRNFFAGAGFRLGPDFIASNQSFRMGVSGGVLLKNNFSLETGLNYSILNAEHYTDTSDFFHHKPHDFHHEFEGHFHDKDRISEITINNTLLQVPVILNYYIPLKRNYGISLSVGTDLDVYLNQKISFNRIPDTGRVDNYSFENKGSVTVFNNMVISAGIEKRWKFLAFQLQPFISPKLKEVFYKPKEMEFGVGFNIKYCFGK
ncbi:MAG: outer membrane beta-barrel protein [Bacteroidota bacterium]